MTLVHSLDKTLNKPVQEHEIHILELGPRGMYHHGITQINAQYLLQCKIAEKCDKLLNEC